MLEYKCGRFRFLPLGRRMMRAVFRLVFMLRLQDLIRSVLRLVLPDPERALGE